MYSSENRLSRNEMWCAADNHNYMSHMCKRVLDSNFNKAVIDKMGSMEEQCQCIEWTPQVKEE